MHALPLADLRVDVDKQGADALEVVIVTGRVDLVRLLLQERRLLNIGTRSLDYAAEEGHAEIVSMLLTDPRVDPTLARNSALKSEVHYGFSLYTAVIGSHVDVVRLLLQQPEVDPHSVLHDACKIGNVGVVKLLLNDPRTPQDDEYALKLARTRRHTITEELLLRSDVLRELDERGR